MTVEYFRNLFDYNYWAHRHVWDYVMLLSDEQFTRSCDYSIGSIHHQVVHTMAAEWLWLSRVRGQPLAVLFNPEDYPTRPTIRTRWDEIEVDWRNYLYELEDVHLMQVIEYRSVTGNTMRRSTVQQALTQILNHGTDHRAQILSLIHQLGGQTIAQDFIFFAWEQGLE